MPVGQCAGFVLAGGRSSRMGTDKAMLLWNGVTLLQHAAAIVSAAVDSVAIIGEPAIYSRFSYPVFSDAIPGSGPLGGIHAALRNSTADWNLIVACDMPGLAVGPLQALRSNTLVFPDADVLLPESDGRAQPLCAVYHRRALPAIEQALLDGRRKIMHAIAPLRVVRLAMSEDRLFRNVNTPAEWSEALEAQP